MLLLFWVSGRRFLWCYFGFRVDLLTLLAGRAAREVGVVREEVGWPPVRVVELLRRQRPEPIGVPRS